MEHQSRQGGQRSMRQLSRQFRASLQADRRRRAAEAGNAVKSLLTSDPNFVKE